MKKIIAIILIAALVVLTLSLCACTKDPVESESESGPTLIVGGDDEGDNGAESGSVDDKYELGGVPLG